MDGEHLGRSRGGLSSKIHLAVDARGLPMSVLCTPGQAGDNPRLVPLLDQISVRRPGPGRPRTRPEAGRSRQGLLTPLDQIRDLDTRYAKRAAYYAAELTIAAIVLWLR